MRTLTPSDELADGLDQRFAGMGAAVAVGRANQPDPALGQEAVQFGVDVAQVGDDQQAASFGEQVGFVVADGHEHLPFVDLRVGQGPGDR